MTDAIIRERRQHARHALACKLRAWELPLFGSPRKRRRLIHGLTENISRGGVCLATDQELKLHSLALSELHFPSVPVPIPVILEVRWIQEDAGNHKYRAGLQFIV